MPKESIQIKLSCKLLSMDFVSVEATGEECQACDDNIYMNQFRMELKVVITMHYYNGQSDSWIETVHTDQVFCQSCANALKEEHNA